MNRHQQRGMTALGWLTVLALIGIFAVATLRLVPIYLEYYRVNSVLTGLKAEKVDGVDNKREIVDYLRKRFDVESIRTLKATDILISVKDENFLVRAKYERRQPFIGNLNFLVTFDKSVEVPR